MGARTPRRWLAGTAIVVAAMAATEIGIATAGASHHPTEPRTVAEWLHGGGSRLLQTLSDDFTALNGPDQAFDLPQMAAGCRHLLADVHSAQAYAAVPDAGIERRWSAALASYATGAADCAHGSETQNYSLIITAATEISRGTTAVVALTPRLNQLGGS